MQEQQSGKQSRANRAGKQRKVENPRTQGSKTSAAKDLGKAKRSHKARKVANKERALSKAAKQGSQAKTQSFIAGQPIANATHVLCANQVSQIALEWEYLQVLGVRKHVQPGRK